MLNFKEWLKEILLENIQGEYWIMDGFAMGADGGLNDFNHEGYAIENARQIIISDAEDYVDSYSYGEYIDWDQFLKDLLNGYVEENPKYEELVDDDPNQLLSIIWKELQIDPEILSIAYDQGDVRNLAMKKWGWKAARGNHVQTWTLTREDSLSIISGLHEVLPYDNKQDFEIELEVMSTRKLYQIPLSILNTGNPMKIMNYDREKQNSEKEKSYSNAFNQINKPSNPFYSRFGD